jgi:hypothetical protein
MAFKNTKLTCSGKSDGGGSQVLAIIGVAAFAEYFGARFVHTPLTYIDHCPKNEKMDDFCANWETIVSLFGFSKTQGEHFEEYSSLEDFLVDFLLFRTRGKLISLGNVHYVTDTHPEVYTSIGLGESSQVRNKNGTKTIYVHVRRGDVTLDGPNSFRYTSDENVRRNIEIVRKQVIEGSEVFVVTEDPSLEFRAKFSDCTIVSEEDPVKVLLLLARADILVMSKSAFSYVAALASLIRNLLVFVSQGINSNSRQQDRKGSALLDLVSSRIEILGQPNTVFVARVWKPFPGIIRR